MKPFLIALLLAAVPAQVSGPFYGPVVSGVASSTVTYASNGCVTYATSPPISCTISGVAAGSTIYVDVIGGSSLAQFTLNLTDTNGTASSVQGPSGWNPSYQLYDQYFVIKNAAAGNHIIQADWGGNDSNVFYPAMNAVVLSGASATSPTDSFATFASATSGTTATSNYVTTSHSNEFILAFCQWAGGPTASVGISPQVMTLAQTTDAGFISEYGTAVTTGSSNYAECTSSATGSWYIDLIAVH